MSYCSSKQVTKLAESDVWSLSWMWSVTSPSPSVGVAPSRLAADFDHLMEQWIRWLKKQANHEPIMKYMAILKEPSRSKSLYEKKKIISIISWCIKYVSNWKRDENLQIMISKYERPQSDNWPHYSIEETIPEKRTPPKGGETRWLNIF